MADNLTIVQGSVIDLGSTEIEGRWLIGQIFVSSNPDYFNDDTVEYLGNGAFVFDITLNPEYEVLWNIFKDDPLLSTGRVPYMPDLNKFDKFFVRTKGVSSTTE